MIAGLPHSVSVQLAAVISGLSRQTFTERYVKTGLVRLHDRRVPLADLERALGRQITTDIYLAADRSLDLYRDKQRARREGFTAAANAATALAAVQKLGSVYTLDDMEVARRFEMEARTLAHELAFADDFVPAEPVVTEQVAAIKPPIVAEPQVAEPVVAEPKPITLSLRAVQQLVEVAYLSRLLAQTGGSMVKAAAIAGMDRCHLHRLAQAHGIKARDFRTPHSNSPAVISCSAGDRPVAFRDGAQPATPFVKH